MMKVCDKRILPLIGVLVCFVFCCCFFFFGGGGALQIGLR